MFLSIRAIEDLMQLLRTVSKRLTELIELLAIDKELILQVKIMRETTKRLDNAIKGVRENA